MAEQVPAPAAPNQVQDVVNIAPAPAVPAPEPVLAGPVAQVEDQLPAVADNVAQNAAPEVTILLALSSRIPFLFYSFLSGVYFNLVITIGFAFTLTAYQFLLCTGLFSLLWLASVLLTPM